MPYTTVGTLDKDFADDIANKIAGCRRVYNCSLSATPSASSTDTANVATPLPDCGATDPSNSTQWCFLNVGEAVGSKSSCEDYCADRINYIVTKHPSTDATQGRCYFSGDTAERCLFKLGEQGDTPPARFKNSKDAEFSGDDAGGSTGACEKADDDLSGGRSCGVRREGGAAIYPFALAESMGVGGDGVSHRRQDEDAALKSMPCDQFCAFKAAALATRGVCRTVIHNASSSPTEQDECVFVKNGVLEIYNQKFCYKTADVTCSTEKASGTLDVTRMLYDNAAVDVAVAATVVGGASTLQLDRDYYYEKPRNSTATPSTCKDVNQAECQAGKIPFSSWAWDSVSGVCSTTTNKNRILKCTGASRTGPASHRAHTRTHTHTRAHTHTHTRMHTCTRTRPARRRGGPGGHLASALVGSCRAAHALPVPAPALFGR